jgi:hypothetical protein
MMTHTRQTPRYSATFLRTTLTCRLVLACGSLVLWSAVAAHASGLPLNGLPYQGLPMNGLPYNGLPFNGVDGNGLPYNGMPRNGLPRQGMPLNGLPTQGVSSPSGGSAPAVPAVPQQSLPWSTLSQRPIGKSTQ